MIEKAQIRAVVKDLEAKKEALENNILDLSDIPPQYMGVAIYNHAIKELKGLMDK